MKIIKRNGKERVGLHLEIPVDLYEKIKTRAILEGLLPDNKCSQTDIFIRALETEVKNFKPLIKKEAK